MRPRDGWIQFPVFVERLSEERVTLNVQGGQGKRQRRKHVTMWDRGRAKKEAPPQRRGETLSVWPLRKPDHIPLWV